MRLNFDPKVEAASRVQGTISHKIQSRSEATSLWAHVCNAVIFQVMLHDRSYVSSPALISSLWVTKMRGA